MNQPVDRDETNAYFATRPRASRLAAWASRQSTELAGRGELVPRMNSKPLVSILIPAYNAQAFVSDAIQSALSQTWPKIEIIVVDDGSTDNTFDVARRFTSANVLIVRQPNQGAAAARNTAFSRSCGTFIQWLDADDLLSFGLSLRLGEWHRQGKGGKKDYRDKSTPQLAMDVHVSDSSEDDGERRGVSPTWREKTPSGLSLDARRSRRDFAIVERRLGRENKP